MAGFVRSERRLFWTSLATGGLFGLAGLAWLLAAWGMHREGPIACGKGPNVIIALEQREGHLQVLLALAVVTGITHIVVGALTALRTRAGTIAATIVGFWSLMYALYLLFLYNADARDLSGVLVLVAWPVAFAGETLRLRAKVHVERQFASLSSEQPADLPPIERYIALLNHSKREMRVEALLALAKMGPDAAPAVPALIEVLKTGDVPGDRPDHCDMCHKKLTIWNRSMGSNRCGDCANRVKAVEQGMERWSLAEMAADVLAAIGPNANEAIPLLEKLSRSRNPLLFGRARSALAAIRERTPSARANSRR